MDILVAPDLGFIFVAFAGVNGSNGDGGKIVRMNLNGFNRKLLLKTKDGDPLCLALNRQTNQLYWTDAVTNSIRKIGVDGKSYHMEYTLQAGAPSGITTQKDRIFWIDRHSQLLKGRHIDTYYRDRAIFIGNLSHLAPSELSTASKPEGFFAGRVAIMENNTGLLEDLKQNHECSLSSSKPRGCSHMCLMSERKFKGTCVCPAKFQWGEDRRTCIPVKAADASPSVVTACREGICHTTTSTTSSSLIVVVSGRNSVDLDYESKTSEDETWDGNYALLIVPGILLILILVGVILGIFIHKRSVHQAVQVRPYVQQCFDNNREEQLLSKEPVDEEMFLGSGVTF